MLLQYKAPPQKKKYIAYSYVYVFKIKLLLLKFFVDR